MNKRAKFLLLCLGLVSLLGLSLACWIYLAAQKEINAYARREAELKKENTYLQEKAAEARRWQEKAASITEALNELSTEHTHLLNQYHSLEKEKSEWLKEKKSLTEKIEELNRLYTQAKEKPQPEAEASDEFLASLLKEKAVLEVEIEKLNKKISAQEEQIESLRAKGERYDRLQEENLALEQELAEVQKVADILSDDLLRVKRESMSLAQELRQAEGELEKVRGERNRLWEQLTQIRAALETAPEAVRKKRRRLAQGEGSIQLPPIVVKAEEELHREEEGEGDWFRVQEQEAEIRGLQGEIITVNEQHRFVVINLGEQEGVKRGMVFDVYRRGKRVGQVQVVELRQKIAACDIKQKSVRRLQVGDMVRR